MFTLIPEDIEAYCESHSTQPDSVLQELYRETNLKTVRPRMISGHSQGLFLEMISRLIRPKRVLELGTFTAYTTICLAKGLDKNGRIYTIEENPELSPIITKYLKKEKISSKTKLLIGNALTLIPSLHEYWDIIYIDADKINYLNYYKMLLPLLNNNGIILVDNVLWGGKISKEIKHSDKDTKAISAFNEYVQNDKGVRNLLLPLRDGMMMIQKIHQ
ncbi:MAG: O-methyltransferase [Bacteroidales bacterium]|nr:O-methyltransferase [Bacteroidales bacterium]MDD4210136.1 O-methyltransferase [Bacteroidales bacterium]